MGWDGMKKFCDKVSKSFGQEKYQINIIDDPLIPRIRCEMSSTMAKRNPMITYFLLRFIRVFLFLLMTTYFNKIISS